MSNALHSSESTSKGIRLDKATALAIGFGLHNTWVCTVMYSTHAVFGQSSLILPGIRGTNLSLIYFISIAAFCLLMFLATGFDQKLTAVSRSRKVMGLAACATCVGTLLALASPVYPDLVVVLECLSGVLTGLGSATLFLYWGIAFAREKTSTSAVTGSIAIALGFALSTLFLQVIPTPFGGVVASIIPLLEFLILRQISPHPPTEGNLYFNALQTSKTRLGISLMAPVALIGFALGVLKQASVQTILESVLTPETIVILLLAGSLTISLFIFQAYMQKDNTWDRFFRIIIPATACVSLLISLLAVENSAFSNLFLLVAYIFIEALVWVYFAHLSHKFHLSPIFLFGLSRGILTLSMLAGAVVVMYANQWLEQMSFGHEGLVIVPLVLIALGYALMPRETDLEKRIVNCPAVRLVALELDEELGFFEPHQPEANSIPPETESRPSQDPFASEAQRAMLGPNKEKDVAPAGKFSRKVKKVAKTYLLTERETDILFELAKGNSPNYIQEKYFISAGTVKTHIRNVYRKLDVHKRNDLLRMIENIEDYD